MTKAEILALIDAKVAGQGNQLDLGGGVVEALKEIVNAMPEGGGEPTYVFEPLKTEEGLTEEQFLVATGGVTFEQLEAVTHIKVGSHILTRMDLDVRDNGSRILVFGYDFSPDTLDMAYTLDIEKSSDGQAYNIHFAER